MRNISHEFPKSGRVKIGGYWSSSDGLVSGRGREGIEFVTNYEKICKETAEKVERWTDKLIKEGIKMAHPDDGWVNREENEVMPCYPYFNYNPNVGDLIALGDECKHRIVKVISKRQGMFRSEDSPMIYYKFVSPPEE